MVSKPRYIIVQWWTDSWQESKTSSGELEVHTWHVLIKNSSKGREKLTPGKLREQGKPEDYLPLLEKAI